MAAKSMSHRLQLHAQLGEVVTLSVVHDRDVAQRHRLCPVLGRIDDTETAMSQANSRTHEYTLSIWTAMCNGTCHARHASHEIGVRALFINPTNSTHLRYQLCAGACW